MLLYTENPLNFAFSRDFSEFDGSKPSIGILGVPFDGTASYMPGARFGPNSIREASYNLESFDFQSGEELKANLFDLGNLQVVHGNYQKTGFYLESTIIEISGMKITPIVLGGEHSISYGVLKALNHNDITVLHFDAHMDLRDTYQGEKFSHATVVRRIYDLNPFEIIQLGVRSASNDEVEFAKDEGIKSYTSTMVKENIREIEKTLSRIKNPVYITLDIDVLDPAYAPSVGTPCTGGINPLELKRLIYSLAGKKIVGFDLVEVSSRCYGDITSLNAAQIIRDVIEII
jgi:agmatinase